MSFNVGEHALKDTEGRRLMLNVGEQAYVDSSFRLYEDGKSVTGIVTVLDNTTIYVKSGKRKVVTRSSTKERLVGISDA